jgi:SMC interacting uncharacterized protein involved in chromosome segregation
MNMEDIALKLQETTDRSLRNEGRIKKLEDENGVLHQLATSVAVMAEQLKNMNQSVSTLTNEVEEMKEKPSKRWEGLVDKIIWAVAAALIGFVLARIGL